MFFIFFLIPSAKGEQNATQPSEKEKKVVAQTARQEKEKKDSELPATISPQTKPFAVHLTLNGFVEDVDAVALSIPTNSWSELKIMVPPVQGASVRKGQKVLKLDEEKIGRQIEQITHDLSILETDRNLLLVELKLAESLAPLKLKEIARSERYVKEDLERFQKKDLPFQKRSIQMNLKRYQDYLLYSEEELSQLQKMYEEDDLTEETEEIILQRARNDVEYMKFYLENARKNFEDFNQVNAPRSQAAMRDYFERENLTLSALKKSNPAQIKMQQLRIDKLELERKNLQDRKKDLEDDLQKMSAVSPLDGKLYWGTFDRGKWSGPQPFMNKLQKGGILKPHEEFVTICPGKKLKALVEVPEKHLQSIKAGTTGKISFGFDPEKKISSKVLSVTDTPSLPGIFCAEIAFTLPKGLPMPAPGSTCSFVFTAYEKDSAITLPSKVVFKEDHDPESSYVFVLNKRGKTKKKAVRTGKQSGEFLEILEGLSVRNKVLKEKPRE